VTTETTIRPFRVDVPEEDLVELRRRIASARWPSKELVEDRSQGVQLATLQELQAPNRSDDTKTTMERCTAPPCPRRPPR
jgi:hypothetical protein